MERLYNAGNMKKLMKEKFAKNVIAHQERFPEVMEKYNNLGRHMTKPEFYKLHVMSAMPNITFRQWEYFIDKLRAVQKEMIAKALVKSNGVAIEAAKMEKTSINNILKIANISLEAVADNPELIHSVPLNTRVNWMFRAMKARDSRIKVALQKRSDDRAQSSFEQMMEGAQYGGYTAEQVPVDDEGNDIIEEADEEDAEIRQIPHELPAGI